MAVGDSLHQVKVIVPYTHIAPGVAEALDATKWQWTGIDVSGSDENYWRVLQTLWQSGETFCIVEHDVLLRPNTLTELDLCESAWCAFPVPYMGGGYAGMACVKFGASLIAACPDALDRVAPLSDASHPPRHWCRLDSWLQYGILPTTGFSRHVHDPPLGHFRPDGGEPWPSHGCIPH
jgi:hypothetical protein